MTDLSLQQILNQQLETYQQHHPLDAQRLKVCRHLRQCRTSDLGGEVYQCDHCAHQVTLYHACRDRHCPQCQQRASRQWSQRQQEAILPMPYYHLVFTLPHDLNGWAQLHPEILYRLLFTTAWTTLKTFGAERLGGALGMTAVLHTWGQNLSQHVHLHCLLPGGALTPQGDWQAAHSTYLFPVKALSRHFRGSLVSALRKQAKQGELPRVIPDEVDKQLDQLMAKDWVVYSKHCLNQTETVVSYLARYSHRIAITHARLTGISEEQVSFRYKDYRDDKQKILSLDCDEFIRRFLLHILPKGFMRIRHYGFLANRCRAQRLVQIRNALEQATQAQATVQTDETLSIPCPKCRQGYLIPIDRLTPVVTDAPDSPG